MKKRILSIILAVLMIVGMLPTGVLADYIGSLREVTSLSGSGTATDPYLIGSLDEMNFFAAQVNGGNTYESKYVRLTADIGDNTTPFTAGFVKKFDGHFQGAGHTVTVNISQPETSYVGLFN